MCIRDRSIVQVAFVNPLINELCMYVCMYVCMYGLYWRQTYVLRNAALLAQSAVNHGTRLEHSGRLNRVVGLELGVHSERRQAKLGQFLGAVALRHADRLRIDNHIVKVAVAVPAFAHSTPCCQSSLLQ